MDTLQQSYPVGQAPWETNMANSGTAQSIQPANSYPVGQAPWEQQGKISEATQTPDPQYQQDPNGYLQNVVQKYAPMPTSGGFSQQLGHEITTGISDLQQIGQTRGKAIAQPLADYRAGKDTLFPSSTSIGAIGKTAEQFISQTAGGVKDTFEEILRRTGSLITNTLGIKQRVKDNVNEFINYLSNSDIAPGLSDKTWGQAKEQVAQKAQEYAAAHPEFATHAETISNLLGAYLSVTGLEEGGTALGKALPTVGESIAKSKIGQAVGSGIDTFGNKITSAISKSPEKSLQDTLEIVKPKLTTTEEAAAKSAGRGTTTGKIFKKTEILPTSRETEMAKAAQEAGVSSKNTFDKNIQLMKDAQKTSAEKIRSGLEQSNAIWNQNDLRGVMDKVEKPITIKSDATLNRTVDNFKKAALKIASGADKKTVGLLDVRQGIDALIEKEFPKNIYTKDSPIGQYVRNFRRAINDHIESMIPDGKLPTGESFKGELRRQSVLYDAIDNVAEKAPKVGESANTLIQKGKKFVKEHPIITGIGAGAIGGGTIKKILP